MKIAHVAAEVAPWCASGGLGQVLGALPAAIAAAGADVDSFFPLCRKARAELALEKVATGLPGGARLLGGPAGTYFVDAPEYFDRASLYGPYGRPYPDDRERFALFTEAVAAAWSVTGRPDIAHVHDWHAALLPHQVAGPDAPATVLTIHNLAYQGVFDDAPDPAQANFLRTGIETADVVTTVSPTYASEILDAGAGLEDSLRSRPRPVGILNGIDIAEWDPSADPALPEPFSADDLAGKSAARARLVDALGLAAEPLLVGVVTRLVEQKGIDLVISLAAEARRHDVTVAVLGDGDPALEEALTDLAAADPDTVAVRLGWDRSLAHLIIAGSDVLAIPSRFEPCGLTQLQAMRYGTIPIAHAVGGLADTVLDPGDDALLRGEGTGITFDEPTAAALVEAVSRARTLAAAPGWSRLQRAVMQRDWSWAGPAAAYLELYRSLL